MSKTIVAAVLLLLSALPSEARAHCDTLDGPVVQAARKALETGKVNPVLAWVRPQDEAEIGAAFTRALAVRKSGAEARDLADTWFFETVVRAHRAGEGAAYTGLKPAGEGLGPAIAAADKAIDSGSSAAVEKLLVDAVKTGVHERFARLKAQRRPGEDVVAGRAWVQAYVPYVHDAEGVYEAAARGAGAHAEPSPAPAPAPAHAHEGH